MSDPSPFEGKTPVPAVSGPASGVTMISGRSFALCDGDGNMSPNFTQGLFILDTRVLSHWALTLNGEITEPLGVDTPTPSECTFAGRGRPALNHVDADIVVIRRRGFDNCMRERIEITNHGLEAVTLQVGLAADCDFADLFEVKESRLIHRDRHCTVADSQLRFTRPDLDDSREVIVDFGSDAHVDPSGARWSLLLDPRESWMADVSVTLLVGGKVTGAPAPDVRNPNVAPETERQNETNFFAVLSDDTDLMRTVGRTSSDLATLRIHDEAFPNFPLIAAGAPWFMTLFGRDSLLTAWMSLPADPSLARGVLETLARLQGDHVDQRSGEEPGKILHEVRYSDTDARTMQDAELYFGSIDSTLLFVILAAELQRWNPSDELREHLLPHVDRAMEWIEQYGDRDGDGFVEYLRAGDYGLVNQGWKDSWDAVRHADGSLATGSIALCEVQGYTYAAYLARAELAKAAGDAARYRKFLDKAAELYERFNQEFWDEAGGFYALALDGAKNRVAVPTSNMGHCLWSGIVAPERARAVADRLMSESMNSGWGIRTLDSLMPAYNPVSYHDGSVWPHDNAICAWGLSRYGFQHEAGLIIEQQLAVATAYDGRLPELFAGFDREAFGTPAIYPSSCSPQAWASAAPLLWLRTMLRLEPLAGDGRFWLSPQLPDRLRSLRVSGVAIGNNRVQIDVADDRVSVTGTGQLAVVSTARPIFDPVAAVRQLELATTHTGR